MISFFGGPVYAYPQQLAKEPSWASRAFDIVVQTFGNTRTAILLVAFVGYTLWLKFGKRK